MGEPQVMEQVWEREREIRDAYKIVVKKNWKKNLSSEKMGIAVKRQISYAFGAWI